MGRADPEDFPATPLSDAEERAFAEHDLRSVAWCWLEGLRREAGHVRAASPAASMMRVILATSEDAGDLAEAAEVATVNGLMVHGHPPRNEREWEIAGRIYEAHTIKLMKTWQPLTGMFAGETGDGE